MLGGTILSEENGTSHVLKGKGHLRGEGVDGVGMEGEVEERGKVGYIRLCSIHKASYILPS